MWRILARAQPDLPATEVFSAVEIQVLHLRVTKALPPAAQSLTLREIVRMLGKLGGHLGRKGDGEPGVLDPVARVDAVVRVGRDAALAAIGRPGRGALSDALLRT